MSTTTIKVETKTRDKLASLKVMDRETFDAVIWRLINNQVHEIPETVRDGARTIKA